MFIEYYDLTCLYYYYYYYLFLLIVFYKTIIIAILFRKTIVLRKNCHNNLIFRFKFVLTNLIINFELKM